MRDRVVLLVLAAGVIAAVLSWRLVGPWCALAIGLVALAVACVAYRIEAPCIDVEHPEAWGTRQADSAQRIDQ